MSKLGNKELARVLVEKYEIERTEAERLVSLCFDVINEGLRNDKLVKVKGLGTFKVTTVAPRKSVDVNTGESIVIEGRDKIVFTADKSMADEVNRPFAQFDTVLINDGVSFDEIDQRYAAAEEEEQLEPVADDTPAAQEPVDTQEEESVPAEQPTETANPAPVVSVPPTFSVSPEQLLVLNGTPRPKEKAAVEATEEMPEAAQAAAESPVEDAPASTEPTDGELSATTIPVAQKPSETGEPTTEEPRTEQEAAVETLQNNAIPLSQASPLSSSKQSISQATDNQQEILTSLQYQFEQLREYNDELYDTCRKQRSAFRWTCAVGALLLVACVAVAAYLSRELMFCDNRIKHLDAQLSELLPVTVSEGQAAVASADSIQAVEDSVKAETAEQQAETAKQQAAAAKAEKEKAEALAAAQREAEEAQKAKAAAEAKAKAEQKAKAAEPVKASSAQPDYNKDPRIRYGAYSIVGIDHTVTVREGQTLAGISKSQLGPGMECYVEAVNGGRTTFKAGEKINIPKLKLKKK